MSPFRGKGGRRRWRQPVMVAIGRCTTGHWTQCARRVSPHQSVVQFLWYASWSWTKRIRRRWWWWWRWWWQWRICKLYFFNLLQNPLCNISHFSAAYGTYLGLVEMERENGQLEISICLRLLGLCLQTLTGAVPLDPAGRLPFPDPLFCPL